VLRYLPARWRHWAAFLGHLLVTTLKTSWLALAIMLTVLWYALLLASPLAHGQELSYRISPGALSYHGDRSVPHNEVNPGLIFEVRQGEYGLLAGRFQNSFWRPSTLLAYHHRYFDVGGFNGGLATGVVDGYPAHDGKFSPLVVPTFGYEYKHVGVTAIIVPPGFGNDRFTVIGSFFYIF